MDYLSLLGQAPAKKEDQTPKEGSPVPESDLPADPEKEVDPSGKGQQNFTEYNIYLQEKKKYEINKDVLGLIKDGVDVKPVNLPVSLHMRNIDILISEFRERHQNFLIKTR